MGGGTSIRSQPANFVRESKSASRLVKILLKDCLAWLRERGSGRLLYIPTAGPFVAEEADARQAGPHAVSARVGQVWVFSGGSSLSFPPLSFVFEGVSPVLFRL